MVSDHPGCHGTPQLRPVPSRPTVCVHPGCQASPPGTQGVDPTPAVSPRHMIAGTGNTVFCIWQPCAHDSGNKIDASAHGNGIGRLSS